MNANELKELEEIEKLANDVSGMISVTRDSCAVNEYINEEAVLNYALDVQNLVVEKILNLNMSSLP